MSGYPFPGPIAPENNPPINPQYFQPSRFVISAISTGITTTVTTSVDHNYVIGQEIRLLIPPSFGSYPLSMQTGFVLSIPGLNEVVVNINSQYANPFNPSGFGNTPPQIIAIGDINSGIISQNGRVLNSTNIPGAFINISPL